MLFRSFSAFHFVSYKPRKETLRLLEISIRLQNGLHIICHRTEKRIEIFIASLQFWWAISIIMSVCVENVSAVRFLPFAF